MATAWEFETGWQQQDEVLVNNQTREQPGVLEEEQMLWEQHE